MELGIAALVFVFVFLIGLAVGAIILRLACKIVGAPDVPFGRAMLIVLVVGIVGMIVQFGLAATLGQGIAASIASILAGAVVAVVVYSKMIPSTIGQAILIYVAQIVVVILIAIVFVLLFGALGVISS